MAPLSLQHDTHDRALMFVTCMTVSTTIALVLVSLRMYTRLKIVRRFGMDDFTILLAMFCNVIALWCNGVQVSYGLGQDFADLTVQQQIGVRKWSLIMDFPVIIGNALSKISVSLLLLRILGIAASPMQRYILNGLNGFAIFYTLLDIFNNVSACSPAAKLWDLELPGTCRSLGSIIGIIYARGVCSAAVALILSALPAIFFGKLQQVNRRTKIVICLLMGLGVFDGACSIMRSTQVRSYHNNLDYSYAVVRLSIWANLEINFATMAACIPTLGCLFRSFNGSKNVISRSSAPNYKKQSEAVQSGLFLSKQNPENYGQYVLASHGQFLLTSNGSFLNSARSEKNTLAFKHVNASGEFKNRIGMA